MIFIPAPYRFILIAINECLCFYQILQFSLLFLNQWVNDLCKPSPHKAFGEIIFDKAVRSACYSIYCRCNILWPPFIYLSSQKFTLSPFFTLNFNPALKISLLVRTPFQKHDAFVVFLYLPPSCIPFRLILLLYHP